MALKKEDVEAMAKALGLDTAKVVEALTSDAEVQITVPEGTFIPKADEEDYKQRLTKPAYEEGKKAGVEIAVKDWKAKEGITTEGKTLDVLIPAIKAKTLEEAKLPADEKVKEANRKYDTLLKEHEAAIQQKESEIQALNGNINTLKTEGSLMPLVPEKLTGLKPVQFLKLFKAEYEPVLTETGELVVKQFGKIVEDKLAKPRSARDIMTEFAIENKWLLKDGAGGGNESGGGSKWKDEAELISAMKQRKASLEELNSELEAFRKSKK